ncbi:ABC transporter permease [Streptosporangium sp. NPDC051023]|uniref:ABC transporter permease n=1 Tax=Streptosporangium sp. NPDC051023 TaxID=3155410 RepID=UPI00344DA6F6
MRARDDGTPHAAQENLPDDGRVRQERVSGDRVRGSLTGAHRFLRDRQVRAGALVTALVVLVAVLGPLAAPYAADELVGLAYGAPAPGAPLGYDYLGADVLSRMLLGGRSIVLTTVCAAVLALLAGGSIGMLAAWTGRFADRAVLWCADVLLAFPHLILVLLAVAMLGRSRWLIVATVAITLLPGTVRLARSLTLGVMGQEYVEAARLMGYPRRRILFREILPNITTPLLVHLGAMLTWSAGLIAAMSFLGYGVAAPAADWGLMIDENRGGLRVQPWAVLGPVVLIALFALGVNTLAEGLGRAAARAEEEP